MQSKHHILENGTTAEYTDDGVKKFNCMSQEAVNEGQ